MSEIIRDIKKIKPVYFLGIILALAGFTHLWNAVGFPDLFFDEGVYMARAMHVLNGLGPQDGYFHDHPFFGQIFLAAFLEMIGFPDSLHPSTDVGSIELLYLAPRILMGFLAVLDTFLVYLIADTKYGKKVALASSLLFAVMPITWITRRILLDSILLPFLLSSILLALKTNSKNSSVLALGSGVFLGLAIFTKIPVFVMIPLVAGLVYFNAGKNYKSLALCILPAILIPLIWPLQAMETHQLDIWMKDVLWQTQRHSIGLPYISLLFLEMDPVLFALGVAGMVWAILKRDRFVLFWAVPFVLFLLAIGYNQYFYWIPILPVFCISASLFIAELARRATSPRLNKHLFFVTIFTVALFGFVSTVLVINVDMSNTEFQAASFLSKNVPGDTTVLASPTYSWVLNYIFHKQNVPNDYSYAIYNPIHTARAWLVVDPHFLVDPPKGKGMQQIYNYSKTVATFDKNVSMYDTYGYPYSSLRMNLDGTYIAIKAK